MLETLGIILFALGILVSLCLHEFGHLGAARAFGMKVTRYFVGYGPTLFSFRRGEIEYGVKAIPAGAFVKIVGMVPHDYDVPPADEHRAMWRYPAWKRTVVMAAGAAMNFGFGVILLWGLFAFVPLPDEGRLQREPVRVATVAQCTPTSWSVDPATNREPQCVPGQHPASAAAQLGLRPGDVITAINGTPVRGWDALTATLRTAGGQRIEVGFVRDGRPRTGSVILPVVQRVRPDVAAQPSKTVDQITPADLEHVGVLGVTPAYPRSTAGPVGAIGRTGDQAGYLFDGTLMALQRFPAKVPALWASLTGAERDPQTPISMVGASRIGGELAEHREWPAFVLLLAGLNFFYGVFNLLPLLPLDGGHIAIYWFEKARAWLYARFRRPDPGRVDYFRLMPLTYAVIIVFGVFTVLTVAADIVNPIRVL